MNNDLTQNDYGMDEVRQTLFKNRIRNLLDVSPSDAGATTNITKNFMGYKGVFRIFSSEGEFVSKTSGRDLDKMTQLLIQTMYEKIDKWRKARFAII